MDEGRAFLHVTTWDPANLRVGQQISVGGTESNYWLRKHSTEWAEEPARSAKRQAEELFKKFEAFARAAPAFAETVETLGRAISFFEGAALDHKFRGELLKEYLFEEVRRELDETLPSRRRCMFLFDEVHDPAAYLATMSGMAAVRSTMLRVRAMPDARWHRARTSLLNCNQLSPEEIKKRAREYWSVVAEPSLDSEILLVGNVTLLEIIRSDQEEKAR